MAIVTTTIAMTGSYQPYERPSQPASLWTAIPRGLQSFIVPTALLDAKPATDDQDLILTATLPTNFAYVLMDYSLSIAQSRASEWADETTLNLQNYYIAPINDSVALSNSWTGDFPTQGLPSASGGPLTVRNSRHLAPLPSFPMYSPGGTSGILVRLTANNPSDPAAAAGTVNAYISFWQFDLEQIRKYPINSPYPVHAR